MNKRVNIEIKELTQKYLAGLKPFIDDCDDKSANLSMSLERIMTIMLPIIAISGSLKDYPNYTCKQKIIYTGNRCTANVLEHLEGSGALELMEILDKVEGN